MRMSLSPRFPANLDRLRVHNVSQPSFVDFHDTTGTGTGIGSGRPGSGRIYWTDFDGRTKRGWISRAFLNGSQMERVLETGLYSMEGLAVDWLGQNLFWSDSRLQRIEAARLDGAWRRVIVWHNTEPRLIALQPTEGYAPLLTFYSHAAIVYLITLCRIQSPC